jgi:hypothetical protein
LRHSEHVPVDGVGAVHGVAATGDIDVAVSERDSKSAAIWQLDAIGTLGDEGVAVDIDCAAGSCVAGVARLVGGVGSLKIEDECG